MTGSSPSVIFAPALARLMPRPGELLWDVGAGAGSIAIEWMRSDPNCRAVAVERNLDRVKRIRRNAEALGVPGLEVLHGEAPGALAPRVAKCGFRRWWSDSGKRSIAPGRRCGLAAGWWFMR